MAIKYCLQFVEPGGELKNVWIAANGFTNQVTGDKAKRAEISDKANARVFEQEWNEYFEAQGFEDRVTVVALTKELSR